MRNRNGIPILLWLVVALVSITVSAPSLPKRTARTHHVRIAGFKYVPERLELDSGDTVIWTNEDVVPHTATARKAFDSGNLKKGQSWRYLAKRPGSFPYICTYHPTMKAELVVR